MHTRSLSEEDTSSPEPAKAENEEAIPHLLSARSAADLSSILEEILSMSLMGLNARVMVSKSNESGLGLDPVSARLNELAGNISGLIDRASREAVEVSRLTYKISVADRAHAPLKAVLEDSVRQTASYERLQGLLERNRQQVRDFQVTLDMLHQRMWTAEHLAVNTRIEASRVSDRELRVQFEGVAGWMRSSVRTIEQVLQRVRPRLEELRELSEKRCDRLKENETL